MSDDPPDSPAAPVVLVSDRQSRPVDQEGLSRLARECLEGEAQRAVELSISFVEPDEMERLHLQYLGEPGPTDVLSFPLGEVEDGVTILGDVVICPAVAAGQNPDAPAELRLLLAHGILHLLGYEHEEEDERAEMWVRQERYSGVRVP